MFNAKITVLNHSILAKDINISKYNKRRVEV